MARSTPRILCVDDDADTCEMLSYFLGRSGYQVNVAASMADALKLAIEERFDLYLLDLRFSDGSGIELYKQIRAFDSLAPVVIFSGDVRECVRHEAMQAGVQHFFRKPVSLEDLQKTVALLIGKSRNKESLCL
jgi:DNA-binding response OmpR family regulator